ncbi:hypothetical protein HDU97_008454 [Phlyctochytrium planicorne]|nr:hypothetical protein HDU97_008454 [Phlyctochytrium planicorne]
MVQISLIQWAGSSALSSQLDYIDLLLLSSIIIFGQICLPSILQFLRLTSPTKPVSTHDPKLPSTSRANVGCSTDPVERKWGVATQTERRVGSPERKREKTDSVSVEVDSLATDSTKVELSPKFRNGMEDLRELKTALSELIKMIRDSKESWVRISEPDLSWLRVFRFQPLSGSRIRVKIEAELEVDHRFLAQAVGSVTNTPTVEALFRKAQIVEEIAPNFKINLSETRALRLLVPARSLYTMTVTEWMENGGFIKLSRSCDHNAVGLDLHNDPALKFGIVYIAADVIEEVKAPNKVAKLHRYLDIDVGGWIPNYVLVNAIVSSLRHLVTLSKELDASDSLFTSTAASSPQSSIKSEEIFENHAVGNGNGNAGENGDGKVVADVGESDGKGLSVPSRDDREKSKPSGRNFKDEEGESRGSLNTV